MLNKANKINIDKTRRNEERNKGNKIQLNNKCNKIKSMHACMQTDKCNKTSGTTM